MQQDKLSIRVQIKDDSYKQTMYDVRKETIISNL